MRIFVIVAGTNEPSNSNMLADAFIQGIQRMPGTETEKRRLKDLHIEHFTLDFYDPVCTQEEDFCILQSLIEQADGLVIATPVWNFGVPGHLKNLIDRMGSFALDETRSKGTLGGKPFYLIFTGGTPAPAWALYQMTTSFLPEALRYFGATALGSHFEPKCVTGRGRFGLVVHERPMSLAAMQEKGYAFAKAVKDFRETGKLPLMQKIRGKMMKMAETVLKKIF